MSHGIRVVAVAVVLLIASCKKSEKTEASAADPAPAAPASPTGAAPAAPVPTETPPTPTGATEADGPFAKSTLTEDKLQRYIKSLGEKSPFDERAHSLEESTALGPKQDAFAKKYGFASGDEYSDVAQRVTMGTLQIGIADGMASQRASLTEGIANFEKQMNDPALPAETKASLTEMIANAKKELAATTETAPEPGMLNAADQALVRKFQPQIAAAEKAKLDRH